MIKKKNLNLFNLLRPNSKGVINKRTVAGLELESGVYAQVGKIVEELIEFDEDLNFEEFCKALDIVDSEKKALPENIFELSNESELSSPK